MHLSEFFGAESLGQRYLFLADVIEALPQVRVVVHDDTCHLRKYVAKRAGDGELAGKMAYPALKYVVDRFHSKGHVDPWCRDNCLHTTAENAPFMAGVNSSACEQLLSSLGRYKYIVSKMGRATATFYLNEVVELRNRARFGAL